MEIELMDNLKIETDRNIRWNPGKSYKSRIKICFADESKTNIIYHGYIVEAEINNIGKTSQIVLKAMSASCLLDRKIESQSFQNTAKTYGEVVRESVQADGGQVIRNQETDKKLNARLSAVKKPHGSLQTVWQNVWEIISYLMWRLAIPIYGLE